MKYFSIYIDGKFVRSFGEKEKDIAEAYYEACYARLESCKYPKIEILKTDIIQ